MKYAVILFDGMADYPLEALGGKTPMEAAKTPNMDSLAKTAEAGLCKTVADGMSPGSDVANLAVMGYNAEKCYTGRSPLEAANMGIELGENDLALRCNLVTLDGSDVFENMSMRDYCAGDISSAEAAEIIKTINEAFADKRFSFHAGVSYRHCLVWHDGRCELGHLTPPHDISGKVIGEYLNTNPVAAPLIEMMKKSGEILKNHPVNLARIAAGKLPASHIWFWGQGTRPGLDNFYEKTGLKASVISAVDLLKGIGRCSGMSVVDVEGATGYIDTDFEGKAAAAVSELKRGQNYVYIHVEAPDECGHRGETENKVKAIEYIDARVLKPLLDYLRECGEDYSVLIMPDHPTPISTKTHARDAVPFLIYKSNDPKNGVEKLTEKTAAETGIFVNPGYTILEKFISKKRPEERA